MKRLLLTGTMVLWAVSGFAQEVTPLRYFLVPKTTNAKGDVVPKYVAALQIPYAAMRYGLEDVELVSCAPDAAQLASLTANLDVIALPAVLDDPIGLTAVATVQTKMEGMFIPADWVNQDTTWRQVISAVGRMFLFRQRLDNEQLQRFFQTGITLDTRINQLPANVRTALNNAALSLGLDTSSITGPMLVRQALRILGQQLPGFTLGGEVFP